MNQYIEHIRNEIIEAVTTTKDEETLQLIYGLLMNASELNSEECLSTS